MKFIKVVLLAGLVSASSAAKADVGVFLGITYAFGGGGPGITLKALSSDKEDKAVVGAGVSYYPLSAKRFGADVSVGYNFDNAGVMAGYDFLQSGITIGAGYVNTDDDNNNDPAPAPTPTTVPPPVS